MVIGLSHITEWGSRFRIGRNQHCHTLPRRSFRRGTNFHRIRCKPYRPPSQSSVKNPISYPSRQSCQPTSWLNVVALNIDPKLNTATVGFGLVNQAVVRRVLALADFHCWARRTMFSCSFHAYPFVSVYARHAGDARAALASLPASEPPVHSVPSHSNAVLAYQSFAPHDPLQVPVRREGTGSASSASPCVLVSFWH